jgi:hypothetical protein
MPHRGPIEGGSCRLVVQNQPWQDRAASRCSTLEQGYVGKKGPALWDGRAIMDGRAIVDGRDGRAIVDRKRFH